MTWTTHEVDRIDHDLLLDWVDELRDGGHPQAYGRLRDVDGAMCAFGVLIDVAFRTSRLDGRWGPACGCDQCKGIELVPLTAEGTSIAWGEVLGLSDATEHEIIQLNDHAREPFDVIADWVKNHVSTSEAA